MDNLVSDLLCCCVEGADCCCDIMCKIGCCICQDKLCQRNNCLLTCIGCNCNCNNCSKCNSNSVNCVRVFYSCSVCLLGIVLIACSATAFANITTSLDDFKFVIENWQQDVVVDLKINDLSCLQQNQAFYYQWQGTVEGCQCDNGLIQVGKCCDNKQRSCNNCYGYPIHAVEPRNFTRYGLNYNGILYPFSICFQRLNGYNFLKRYPKENKCEQGQKACGGKDSLGLTLFCVPPDSPCPITDIKFSLNSHLEGYENKGLIMNTPYSLFVARDNNHSPLSQTRISEGLGVCMNSYMDNLSPAHEPYILEGPKKREECDNLDYRFVASQETKLSERDFFSSNYALDMLTKQLPKYQISDRLLYQHYYKGYMPISYFCRSEMKNLIDNQQKINKISDNLLALLIICCLLGGYLLLFEFWFVWLYTDTSINSAYYIGVIFPLKMDCASCFTLIIKIILMISMAVIIAITHLNITDEQSFLDDIVKKDCMDYETQQLFEKINQGLETHLINVILFFWLVYWIFEPNMMYFWLNSCNRLFLCLLSPCYDTKQSREDQYKVKQNQNEENNNYQPQMINNNIQENQPYQQYNQPQQQQYYQQQNQQQFQQQQFQPYQQQQYQEQQFYPNQPQQQYQQQNIQLDVANQNNNNNELKLIEL